MGYTTKNGPYSTVIFAMYGTQANIALKLPTRSWAFWHGVLRLICACFCRCTCPNGFTGERCEIQIGGRRCGSVRPCMNGGTCEVSTGKCLCRTGWVGDTCSEDLDECKNGQGARKCGSVENCYNFPGGFGCNCTQGRFPSTLLIRSICLMTLFAIEHNKLYYCTPNAT